MGTIVPSPPLKNPKPGPEEELNGKQMSFLEHLEELRQRLMHSIISIVVAAGICFYFREKIYGLLAEPLTDTLTKLHLHENLVYTNPVDPFNLYIKLSLVGGLFLACPYVLYQIWLFISPGLYKHEKRYIWPFIIFSSSLFLTGGFFAWKFAFPAALEFLVNFAHSFTPMITINEYWDLAIQIIVAVGLIFELPVVILILSVFGIVTPKFLWKNLRYAVLVTAVLSAAIIPSNDLASIFIVWIPLVALYMLSILLSWLVWMRRKKKKLQAA
ncbi:MAG: twin-arginine translocase subunit TatC [Terriglobia bacterium]